MSNLQAFLSAPSSLTAKANRFAGTGNVQPRGNYVAVVLAVAGIIPAWGSSYSYGTVPTEVTMDGSTVVAALKDLAFNNKAWFFGDGLVNGKAGKPKELMESQAFGSRTQPRPTGEVAEQVDFVVDDTFLNIPFWNSLRAGLLGPVDVFLFTDMTVQVIRWETEKPVFMGIGSEITGNYEQDIPGGFSVAYTRKTGQIPPQRGVLLKDLSYETLKYTFGAATPAPTNLALIAGTTNRYNMTTGTAAKIKRAVVEPGAVRYSVYANSNEPIPSAQPVLIDTDTGELTIGSAIAVGRYVYTVAAENEVGVWGSYTIEVVVKAA